MDDPILHLDPAAMDWRQWSDLPADVLREISSHVCAATGFVYFHAICKPWRASRDPMSRRMTSTQFLPWLLAPANTESTQHRFRCVFSNSSYHGKPSVTPPAAASRNWVSSADGTEIRYLTVEDLCPTLHDPVMGEFTRLPVFPDNVSQWEEDNPRGVIYGDGTTFLYSIRYVGDNVHTASFRAALLRPGSDRWTVVQRTLQVPSWRHREFCVAYHGGKIMLTVEATLWRVITPERGDNAGDLLVTRPPLSRLEREYYWREYSYILQSRGDLLWVSVNVDSYTDWQGNARNEFSITVHKLELEAEGHEKKARWVKQDGCSMADRVLFLGTPSSFAVDASRLGGLDAGCAYFVYHRNQAFVGVFSYNLLSGKAKFYERLPHGWNDERCTWHVPQPNIAPIQELMKTRELKKQRRQQTALVIGPTLNIHIRKHYEPSFKVIVRNMPRTMRSSQLKVFLSNHGKVSSAEVLYYKKTKHSQGIGLVTMSTLHTNHEDALDALNALSVEGYNLKFKFVKGTCRSPCSTGTL